MGDRTKIAWTDSSWNPLRGCSKVSAGCKNCYAETMAARFAGPGGPYEGTIEGRHWNGQIRLVPEHLDDPLRWTRPRKVFVNSMSDLFHDGVSFEYIAAVFGVMAVASATRGHVFQILTKRPASMREVVTTLRGDPQAMVNALRSLSGMVAEHHITFLSALVSGDPGALFPAHIYVSAEDQATVDERIPLLLDTQAAVRGVSLEPLLGPIDFRRVPGLNKAGSAGHDIVRNFHVIVGGESGPGARPCDVAWIRSIVEQCHIAGVPCFVKQLGARPVQSPAEALRHLRGSDAWSAVGNLPGAEREMLTPLPMHLKHPKGGSMAEWPADLRVQEDAP